MQRRTFLKSAATLAALQRLPFVNASANDVQFGLTASIYTQDFTTALRFVEQAEVGMVHVNQPTVGGEAQLPFGGIKATGVGEKEMAEEGANFFTYLKTVFFDYTGSRRTTNIY